MARDVDGIIQTKYANSGDVGLGGLDLNELWPIAYSTPGGTYPQREQFNQLFRYLSALAVEVNQDGPFLDYSATIDYSVGAVITGTDLNRYECLIANGPTSSVVDPVGDTTGTWILDNFKVMAFPEDHGAVGDGVANDTTAVLAAMNSGAPTLFLSQEYDVGAMTVPSTVKNIIGGGKLIQRLSGVNILNISSPCIVDNVRFQGDGGTTFISGNNAIYILSTNNVIIKNCHFSAMIGHAVFAVNTENIWVSNNFVTNSNGGIRFRAVLKGFILHNELTSSSESSFTVAIALDSTNGHAFGICQYIAISNNIVEDYNESQAILVHSGQHVVISGNTSINGTQGISINPFNVTDEASDIAIIGNTNIGAATGLGGDSQGISCGGFSGNPVIRVTISGNTIRHGNRANEQSNQGSIGIGWVDTIAITGNSMADNYGNGIVFNNPGDNVTCIGNTITSIVAAGGDSYAIKLVADMSNTTIKANTINVPGFTGIRVESGYTMDFVCIDENNIDATTISSVPGANVAVQGVLTYQDGDATPLVRFTRTISISNSSPTTIVGFDGPTVGQLLILSFNDSNTTVNRDNAYLAGGANFVSTNHDVLALIYDSNGWKEISRSANS